MIHFLINQKKNYNNIISKKNKEFVPFKSVQRSRYEAINNIILKEVSNFMDIPEDHVYFKTLENKPFLVNRKKEYLILMSEKQAKILLENWENVFFDGTNFLSEYNESEEAKILHKKCQFLAFIPVYFIPKVFNLLKRDSKPSFLNRFINYFEKNYIKKNIESLELFYSIRSSNK